MSSDTPPVLAEPEGQAPEPVRARSALTEKAGLGDRAFAGSARAAAVFILVIMAAIAGFLIYQAVNAISQDKVNFLTSFAWDPDGNNTNGVPTFGIAAIAWGTLVTSVVGVLLGAPVAIGVALFITQYVPRKLGSFFGYIVDLLAAVPSVVYGLWGLLVLDRHMSGVSKLIEDVLGWIPMFKTNGTYGSSMFTAGVVLAIMILPIVAAISREIYKQTPREQIEAAYALGATKWEMIRLAVLPYGRSGVTSAVILGFGRALGETIAVAMVLTTVPGLVTRILQPGGNTIAANIAVQFGEAFTTGRQALIASGLVLFLMTLIVNYVARLVIRRSTNKAGA
ncbi:phosphate ABC transporter permease subunit PstC [Actinospica sp. MGRD01-02]|uniref:Phosphate transport system permease protein n=1 Tax=Actinospica acidithermotolerans TaxID=2828514 RepID=A0A941E6C3_9ACTN|nr:phosphate ABC transporter permease subunit PstC [Actinospica acidithermotolerans]MBR7825936.1 phosphate ABC transporter permease subunit PstC [Actinospica acidithermotolerans]